MTTNEQHELRRVGLKRPDQHKKVSGIPGPVQTAVRVLRNVVPDEQT
jgi:hypothetical protein